MIAGLLSSDVLEQQFGPTEVEILYQDQATRIIATRAADSGQVLELSRVKFLAAGVKKFPDTHRTVQTGLSMGKAFRGDGIEFVRDERAAYRYQLPASFERLFASRAAATVVPVSILAGPDRTAYAEILETYSPAVRWPSLHGKMAAGQLDTIKLLDKFLAGQEAA